MSLNLDKLRKPPKEALKQITGGRLKGMSDINPQWRIDIMNEVFGPCGIKWYPEIVRQWTQEGAVVTKTTMVDNKKVSNSTLEVLCFTNINLYIWDEEKKQWSQPIPGTGGSTMVEAEAKGANNNDEAFKMSYTDALSVAMKALGVAADIYLGRWDGSKYKTTEIPKDPVKPKTVAKVPEKAPDPKNETQGAPTGDLRPWLSGTKYAQVIKRLKAGEDIYSKVIETFRINADLQKGLDEFKPKG